MNGKDVYQLNILEAPKQRPPSCVAADPDNDLCQLSLDSCEIFLFIYFNDPGFCRNGQCEGLPDEETTMSKGCLVVYSMWVTPRTGDYELHLPKLGQRSMYRHMQLGMKQRVHTVLLQWTGIDEIFTCMSNEHTTAADCINLPFQLRFYANWQAGQMPNWTTALQPSCWLLNND